MRALRSYFKLICEYELHNLPNKKVSGAKNHGKKLHQGQTSPISNRTALISGVYALRSYFKLICEYELHSLPNKKVSGAKDHGKKLHQGQTSPISNHTALILGVLALRSYLKLICEYMLHILPYKKSVV